MQSRGKVSGKRAGSDGAGIYVSVMCTFITSQHGSKFMLRIFSDLNKKTGNISTIFDFFLDHILDSLQLSFKCTNPVIIIIH